MINICRTCGEVTRTIYAEFLYDDQKKVLLHQIEVLTGLWLGYGDSMPSSICAYCVQDLKLAVAFRERYIKVQVKLHRQYNKVSELNKSTVKLRREQHQFIFDNELTSKIILRDENLGSKFQISRLDSAAKFRHAILKSRRGSSISYKQYTDAPTEDYQINSNPLVMDNSNASEESEEMNLHDETYAELATSDYEVIDDESEGQSCEYECNFDDWADNFFNSEDDQKLYVESNMKKAVNLSSEEELQSQEQLISTTVDTENTYYQSETLDERKNIQKCTLWNRSVRQEINQQREVFQLEQHLKNECHIIEKQSREKDGHSISRVAGKTEIEHDLKNIPAGKTKRKYTFITRKPASTEKKKYKPTRSEYVCEICGKSYSKLFTFSEHKLHHTGIKSFKCTECPKAFFTKRLLKQHIIKHTDERPFVCRICSLTFRSRAHRNDHEKKHLNPQPWPCRYCGKKLTTSYARDLHEAAHRGVRKHHCETCDRGFITRKHLTSHKQTKLHKQNLERVKQGILKFDTEFLQ